ncbi:hypothetical protein MPSEU_001005300 [Mayamaea pseudoterrestris]|nr:hypothetical protein MPSEU_001005300 [Mayamaea pseudoterrestris]
MAEQDSDAPFQPPETISYRPETIQVLVYSDIACPWCYIGEKRLLEAIQLYKNQDTQPITVECKPYLIDTSTATEGEPLEQYCQKRFGDAHPELITRLKTEGTKVGAAFGDWSSWPNTKSAHEFVYYGNKIQKVETAKLYMILFQALYEQGRNISLIDQLIHVAEQEFPDWDRKDLRDYLEKGKASRFVRDEMYQGRRCYQITSVPFFLVYSEASGIPPIGFSGAQLPDTFLQVFEEINEKTMQYKLKNKQT